MNAEQISGSAHDVMRRVAMHAALADPTRLGVVDLLFIGDAASSELSERLGVPSNLLAHHLKVLETAGVVERHRSEGDRRRSYWRLLEETLPTAGGPGLAAPGRVLFVCTANSARSHLAAALWRRASAVPVASAGTSPAERIDRGVLATARRHGLDLPDVRPQQLDDVVTDADLVVTVCDLAHEELGATSQVHWSVPDPVAVGARDAFDRAYDDLNGRVARMAPLVQAPARPAVRGRRPAGSGARRPVRPTRAR